MMSETRRGPARRGALLWVLRIAVPLALAVVAVVLVQRTREEEVFARSPWPVYPAPRFDPHLVGPPALAWAVAEDPEALPLQFTLEAGETLGTVFAGLGLQPEEARGAVAALRKWLDPRKLKAGDSYAVYLDEGLALASFEMEMAGKGRVRLDRAVDGWLAGWRSFERTVGHRVVQGHLATSLEEAIRQGDGPALLAYEMADVLQWDLDFTRDLRVGDRFEALFEEIYLDGDYHAVGPVVALRYSNRGRLFEAYRYGEGDSYYDADGRPMQKMFLRSPLRFSRVTSRFSNRRFHPILKTYRPHYGVDYGAPTGTPVRVTASGTVTFAGWDRGGGKMVKVRHPRGYLTAYLHLSRFGDGISPGRALRQGDVVGYVGSTGLATAPHLDYRVSLNGRWIDPLTIGSVPAKPLSSSQMPAFLAWRDALRSSLESGEPRVPAEQLPAAKLAAGASALGTGTASLGRR